MDDGVVGDVNCVLMDDGVGGGSGLCFNEGSIKVI
jgi:hypothetical protein